MKSLHEKTLVMIIGPTAVGKSTLMHEIARLDPRFGYVESFTTRPQRAGEVSTYRHISESTAHDLHDDGKTVTYFEHPTTHVIYGTTVESYNHEFNLLDTLSGSVEMYRDLPFANTVSISVTTSQDAWSDWLLQRFPTPSIERTKRLHEAVSSIEWSLAQNTDHHWVINTTDALESNAKRIVAMLDSNSTSTLSPPQEATKLLAYAKSLLSYE